MSAAALWVEVKLVYDSQTLKELTNRRDPAASTVGDTLGEKAAQHAINWFERVAQVTFSSSNAAHLEVAANACFIKLKEWSGKYNDLIQQMKTAAEDDMKNYRSFGGGGKRVTHKTDSILEPSSEDLVSGPDRPHFDHKRFEGITPDGPGAV